MQARKRQLGFRFNSDGDQRSGTLRFRSPAHSLEERRLSDAGLAPDHNRSPAVGEAIYQRVQDCGLLLALDQLGAGVDHWRRAHRASMSATNSSVQSMPQLTVRSGVIRTQG